MNISQLSNRAPSTGYSNGAGMQPSTPTMSSGTPRLPNSNNNSNTSNTNNGTPRFPSTPAAGPATTSTAASATPADGPKLTGNEAIDREIPYAMYKILDFLKDNPGAHPLSYVEQRTSMKITMEINGIRPLLEAVSSNPRMTYDAEANTLAFKPEHDVGSKEKVLELIARHKMSKGGIRGTAGIGGTGGGIPIAELVDSSPNIIQFVNELEKEELIIVIRGSGKNKDPRILFSRDEMPNVNPVLKRVDEEYKRMWHNDLKIPSSEEDIEKDLEKAGFKQTSASDRQVDLKKDKHDQPDAKKAKLRARRPKITNTHIQQFDLTRQYMPEEERLRLEKEAQEEAERKANLEAMQAARRNRSKWRQGGPMYLVKQR